MITPDAVPRARGAGRFIAFDLLVAYLPMAWLGARLRARFERGTAA